MTKFFKQEDDTAKNKFPENKMTGENQIRQEKTSKLNRFRLLGRGPVIKKINDPPSQSSIESSVATDSENAVLLQKSRFDAMGQLASAWLKNPTVMEKYGSDKNSMKSKQNEEDLESKIKAMVALTISRAKEKDRKSILDDEERLSLIRVFDDNDRQHAVEGNKLRRMKKEIFQMYHKHHPNKQFEDVYDWEEIIGMTDEEKLANLVQKKADGVQNTTESTSDAGPKEEPTKDIDKIQNKPRAINKDKDKIQIKPSATPIQEEHEKLNITMKSENILKKEMAECKMKVNAPQMERIKAGIEKIIKEEDLNQHLSTHQPNTSRNKKKHQIDVIFSENKINKNIMLKFGTKRIQIEEENLNWKRINRDNEIGSVSKSVRGTGNIKVQFPYEGTIDLIKVVLDSQKLIKAGNKLKHTDNVHDNNKHIQISKNWILAQPKPSESSLCTDNRSRYRKFQLSNHNCKNSISYKQLDISSSNVFLSKEFLMSKIEYDWYQIKNHKDKEQKHKFLKVLRKTLKNPSSLRNGYFEALFFQNIKIR